MVLLAGWKRDGSYQIRNGRNRYHLIPYIGNKSGFSHIFDSLIPDSVSKRKIYDVFGGGASFSIYACHRFGSKNVTYNDNNPTIVNFIRWVKNDPRGLYGEYVKHQEKSSSDYYLEVRRDSLDDGLVGAGKFLYLAKNAFSGKIRFNSSNKFNSPMRKNSKCPKMELEHLVSTSKAIGEMTITNRSYESFEDKTRGFMYFDPPYLENSNNHYNGVPDSDRFIQFVKSVGRSNMVMISEQNSPESLGLDSRYAVYSILLNRSLQYFTQKNSMEIIAINYPSPKRPPAAETRNDMIAVAAR